MNKTIQGIQAALVKGRAEVRINLRYQKVGATQVDEYADLLVTEANDSFITVEKDNGEIRRFRFDRMVAVELMPF